MATSQAQTDTGERLASCEVWTPEQQKQELTRRLEVIRGDMSLGISFKPDPDDVIAAIPAKSGTTWMLHICHQIRMQGKEPDFDNQVEVVTWLEATKNLLDIDPADKPQPAKPRIFLTHLPYEFVPMGGRRLYCCRDQKDSLISAYYFLNSLLLLKGRIALPIFADIWMQAVEYRLKDLLIWWEHRHDNDLLLVFFDDLKEDHAGCVRRIAKHIGVDCDEDVIARVVHTTSHAEMSRLSSKFTNQKYQEIIAERVGETILPEDKVVSRVRKGGGKSGDGQQLPLEIQQRIDQLWKDIVTAKLGFQDLNEMREAWKKEQIT